MNQYRKWRCQVTARKMVDVLNIKGYHALYAEDLEEAKRQVLALIPEGSSVALGGSETLNAMGMLEHFRLGNYRFFDRYQKLPDAEIKEIYRQAMLADFLVTGTNAITRRGELVNVDCSGNRAAGILYGPKKVIIVAGANKVVEDLDGAMKRLKEIAPMNALRNRHPTPCTETGQCQDCDSPRRMCNVISIVDNCRKFPGRITVILVAEEAGF